MGSEDGSDHPQVPENYSQLVFGSHHLPWQRSHHYCHVTLARTVEKGIAFGRYTAGMSFHWQLEARYCTSLLAPRASEAAGEEMDKMPWPSHLPYTERAGCVWCSCAALTLQGLSEKLGLLVHTFFGSWDVQVFAHPCMNEHFVWILLSKNCWN